jgi:ribonuclease HII
MVTVGIDEVGRGCWAGPLVAGAAILQNNVEGLKDSKKLNKSQRKALDEVIRDSSIALGLGWVSPQEIDQIGLSKAVGLAMERALHEITCQYDQIIIDGNINYFPYDSRAKAVVKADDSVEAVSAASIIAKVARDNYMAQYAHAKFPEYAFDKHVGYGTKLHLDMLKLHGVSPIHRQCYKPIKALLAA